MNKTSNNVPFWKRSIILNLIYAIVAGLVFAWLALEFVDLWTHHGDERVVPTVTGMKYDQARDLLHKEGFGIEIIDSIHESPDAPGTIVKQDPRVNSKVKPGRIIYVTIVAFTPKTVTIPDMTNISARQAQSILESLGFKKIKLVEVNSEYEGLLLNAKYNGLPLHAGARVPINAPITLEVGKGVNFQELDSLQLDSLINASEMTLDELDLK